MKLMKRDGKIRPFFEGDKIENFEALASAILGYEVKTTTDTAHNTPKEIKDFLKNYKR
jgi:hypothetical protein